MATDKAFEIAAMEGRRPTWEAALFFPDQGRWTVPEYLALDANRHVEYSCGVLELQPMPDDRHQAIVLFLGLVLRQFASKVGGRARVAPLPVRVGRRQFREPDVCFMTKKHLSCCRERYWDGADLVIEVLSESNQDHDLFTKRGEYSAAGIPEYWIVDPIGRTIRVLVLGTSGDAYVERVVRRDGERVSSATLRGLKIDVTEVLDAE